MSAESNLRLLNVLEAVKKNDPENGFLVEIYKRHDKYTPESLVEELRQDGSNTIGRIFTGSVDYDEIVKRVANKLGVDSAELTDNEMQNELLIIKKAIQDYIKKNPEAEAKLKDVADELGVDGKDFVNMIVKGHASAFLMMAQVVGPQVIWRTVALIMGAFVGRQVAFTVARAATLAVPFLNVIMGAWLIFDLSGPAYRKIAPSVLNIALLRLQAMGESR